MNIDKGLRELSLFTGIGGGLLGTHLLGWTPIGYVEINEYCQRVIAQRIADGILPAAPIFTDVREFVQSGASDQYRGVADVVTGGFPCQPFSVAGKRKGADDKRNMWPATMEVIRRVQPTWVFLENVPGLLSSGYFGTILDDLSEGGYDVGWRVLSAAELGAPHLRKRLWIIAHATSVRCSKSEWDGNQPRGASETPGKRGMLKSGRVGSNGKTRDGTEVSDTSSNRRQEQCQSINISAEQPTTSSSGNADGIRKVCHATGQKLERPTWWAIEPELGRLANGIPNRVERLRAIGNGQVPAVAASAWKLLATNIATEKP